METQDRLKKIKKKIKKINKESFWSQIRFTAGSGSGLRSGSELVLVSDQVQTWFWSQIRFRAGSGLRSGSELVLVSD